MKISKFAVLCNPLYWLLCGSYYFDIDCRFHLRASFDILQKAILSRQSSRPMVLSGRYNRTVSSSSDGNENLNGKFTLNFAKCVSLLILKKCNLTWIG